jgi:UDP-N-acetylmuramoyl-tripeptide--D-alanyl-D-alanine ligase
VSIPFHARDVVAWTGGTLLRGDPACRFDAVSIDTRTLVPGALFVAIAGPKHDAHAFLAQAVAAGAAGLVIDAGRALPDGLPTDLPVVAVDDGTRALGALAAGHRGDYTGPLVAITGSNGKTTTKEMCAAILGVSAPCLHNEGNLNNEYGLPLTLLRRDASHRSLVVELGMNHRGEIARLAAIARPTVGVLTNVGTAHIEHLGSQDEIALEKGDLVAALDAGGSAVLNADDARVLAQAERTPARVVRFGLGPQADVRPETLRTIDGRFAFDLCAPEGRIPVEVAGLAETAVANALAAAGAALAAGASLDDAAEGLGRYRPVPGRLVAIALPGGGLLVDDTYNANPQSMEVALRILARLAGDAEGSAARSIAVLGDMGELGEASACAHHETGRLAATLGIDHLFAVGERAQEVAAGATAAGMDAARVHASRDAAETGSRVRDMLRPGDRVLVKGSRAMRMERIVEQLSGDEAR